MKFYSKMTLIALIVVFILVGCNASVTVNKDNNEIYNGENEINQNSKNSPKDEGNTNSSQEKTVEEEVYDSNEEEKNVEKKSIDLQEVKPNEAGQVMIVMYHALSDKEATYVRTVKNFKEDLELLYEKGYRLVSLNDYINNNIEVEPGKTPVVLTFDDGNLSDFNIIEENGEKIIDPNSAVGILKEFQNRYPDFGLEATFFLNGGTNPFRQKELIQYKLDYILAEGMDIGNHSYTHENLGSLNGEDIQKALGQNVKNLKKYISDYDINTLALPFGARPKSEELRQYLYNGSYEDVEYENIGVLAVGWRPEYASIHKDFDFKYINRVHGSSEEFGIRYWMEYFDKHPDKRYISDGDKDIITIPEVYESKINKDKLNDKTLRTYNLEEKSQ